MTVARILTFPDPLLQRRCKPLAIDDQATMRKVQELAFTLRETMLVASGWGLSAPQVGVHCCMFVVHVPSERTNALVFVNPQWMPADGAVMKLRTERCLSFPTMDADVDRYDRIVVRRHDEFGRFDEQTFEGWTARAIQHEYDHLIGTLVTDRVTPARRKMLVKGMVKWQRDHGLSKVPA